MTVTTIPLQDYDDRIKTMLREAVPGSKDVSDWTVGQTNVDWWSLTTPREFDIISQNGYLSRTWRISYEAFYVLGNMNAGDKGPTRKKINILLPQIAIYFATRASMKTNTAGQTKQIPGFVPGSFRAKFKGEGVIDNDTGKWRGLMYTITFNHKEQVQIKEQ